MWFIKKLQVFRSYRTLVPFAFHSFQPIRIFVCAAMFERGRVWEVFRLSHNLVCRRDEVWLSSFCRVGLISHLFFLRIHASNLFPRCGYRMRRGGPDTEDSPPLFFSSALKGWWSLYLCEWPSTSFASDTPSVSSFKRSRHYLQKKSFLTLKTKSCYSTS